MPLTVRGGSSLAWIQNLLRKQREEGVPAQQKDNRKTLNDFIKSINEADQNNDLIVDIAAGQGAPDRKSTRLNSSHYQQSRMPSSA